MRDQTIRCWITPKVAPQERWPNGRGLYAVAPIAKDERIWGLVKAERRQAHWATHAAPLVSQLIYVAVSLDENGGTRFTHSCAPNAGFDERQDLVAMRPIAPDECVSFDYAMCLPFHFGLMVCQCGAPHCRQVITGADWERPALQQRYHGYFLPFIAEKIAPLQQRAKAHASRS